MSLPNISALIVDDEALARDGLRGLLEADPRITPIAEAATAASAIALIAELDPDLVFLDIKLPGSDGFEVLAGLRSERPPVVIFITAYDEFALKAFEAEAFDYLLKPFDDERFATVLRRAKAQVNLTRSNELETRLSALVDGLTRGVPGKPRHLKRLVVRSAGRILFQPVQEIDWLEAADYCTRLHVAGKMLVVREALGTIAVQLDPEHFVRIHRSTVVNLDRVTEVEPYFHGDYVVRLRDGTKLRMSRRRRGELERALDQRL